MQVTILCIFLPDAFTSTSQYIVQSDHRKDKSNKASNDSTRIPTSHGIHHLVDCYSSCRGKLLIVCIILIRCTAISPNYMTGFSLFRLHHPKCFSQIKSLFNLIINLGWVYTLSTKEIKLQKLSNTIRTNILTSYDQCCLNYLRYSTNERMGLLS